MRAETYPKQSFNASDCIRTRETAMVLKNIFMNMSSKLLTTQHELYIDILPFIILVDLQPVWTYLDLFCTPRKFDDMGLDLTEEITVYPSKSQYYLRKPFVYFLGQIVPKSQLSKSLRGDFILGSIHSSLSFYTNINFLYLMLLFLYT